MHTFKSGDCTTNTLSGTTTEIIAIPVDGSGFVIETRIEPNKPPALAGHLHMKWTETFEILSGTASYRLAGKTLNAKAGDKLVFPPGVLHTHPWNTGSDVLHYRQTDLFHEKDMHAAEHTFLVFSTLYGLANDGKTFKDGTPKNPLQLAVCLQMLMPDGGYLEGVPPGAQRVIFGGLAGIGKLLGYRPWYEKYLSQ